MVEGTYTLGQVYAPTELDKDQDSFVTFINYTDPNTGEEWRSIIEICSETHYDLIVRAITILTALNAIKATSVSIPEVGFLEIEDD
jgi:hypothetical protein